MAFSSNQILEISGNKKEQLASAIKFILNYDGKDISNVNGLNKIDGKLIFGWIPKKNDGNFHEEYKKHWNEVLDDKLTEEVLVDFIWNWLQEQEEVYQDIYDKENVEMYDTPIKGFLISSFNEMKDKLFWTTIFYIQPYYTESREIKRLNWRV